MELVIVIAKTKEEFKSLVVDDVSKVKEDLGEGTLEFYQILGKDEKSVGSAEFRALESRMGVEYLQVSHITDVFSMSTLRDNYRVLRQVEGKTVSSGRSKEVYESNMAMLWFAVVFVMFATVMMMR